MPSSNLDALIDADKIPDLSRMYRLFVMVDRGLPVLHKGLRDSILRRGKEINAAEVTGEGEGDNDGEAEEPAEDVKGKGKKKAAPPAKGTATSRAVDVALLWVQNVLDLKDRFERLLKICYNEDVSVEKTINEVSPVSAFWVTRPLTTTKAFRSFVNSNKKSSEFISLFIDENLKKGLKGVRANANCC